MLVIKSNAFDAQKCFVEKLKYQIWIGSFMHMSAFLGILLVFIIRKTIKIVNLYITSFFIGAFIEPDQIPFSYYVSQKNTMTEDDETHTLEVVNEAVTAVAVFNKFFFNYQFKSSNDFMTVFLNSLQKHFCAFQV